MNLNNLNDDCLINILSFLDLKNKIRISRICRRFQIIILNQLKRITKLLISSDFSEFNNFIYFNNQLNIKPEIDFYSNYNILILLLSNKLNLFQFDCLISKFSSLNSIKFKSKKNLELISAPALEIIFKRCKIIKIDLSNCKEIDDNCIRTIAKCSTVEYLNLTNCRNYGNNSLKLVLMQCINLKELHISYQKRLTGQIFRHCKCKLKYLNLEECTHLTDKGLYLLANKISSNLECLITFPISTNQRLEFICSKFNNLNKLKLTFSNEQLNLDILINNLNNNLISLSLNKSIKLTDDYLSKLILKFKQIQEFEFYPNNKSFIYYSLLDLSIGWPKLTKLCLSNIKLSTDQNRLLFESILNLNYLLILNMKNLEDIDEKDIVYFLSKLINKKLNFINLEYYQKQFKNKLNLIAIRDLLNKFKILNYDTSIYYLRLERQNPFLYLSKIRIMRI